MKKIKSCPFCGSKKSLNITEVSLSGITVYSVVCGTLSGGCGASSGYHETKKKAIKAWNRRV